MEIVKKKQKRLSTSSSSSDDMPILKTKPLLAEALPYDSVQPSDFVDILKAFFMLVPGIILAVYVLTQSREHNLIKKESEPPKSPNNVCINIQKVEEILMQKMKVIETVMDAKIKKALMLYDADKTGMIDYALESAGGMVISTPDTITYPVRRTFKVFGLMSIGLEPTPNIILQARTNPGECYAFTGQKGRFRVQLFRPIEVIAVTIEHAAFALSSDLRSAPRDFIIYGLDHPDTANGDELGRFEYNIYAENALQMFSMNFGDVYDLLEIHILRNYGHPNYTCLYRVRVHGKP